MTDVNVLILWLEAVNLNIKQTNGMLRQYVDRELGKHRNSSGRRMSSYGEYIPCKLANAKSFNKNQGGDGDGDGDGDEFNALCDINVEVRVKECNLGG